MLVGEGYHTVLERYDAMIGDGHPMGVASKIGKHPFRMFDGLLHINDPRFTVEDVFESLESLRCLIWCADTGKTQLSISIRLSHIVDILPAKHQR